MVIKVDEFRIKPISDVFYDLYVETGRKDKDGKDTFKAIAYGIPLTSCLRKIIHHRMSLKQGTVDLRGYLDEFNSQFKALNAVVNGNKNV